MIPKPKKRGSRGRTVKYLDITNKWNDLADKTPPKGVLLACIRPVKLYGQVMDEWGLAFWDGKGFVDANTHKYLKGMKSWQVPKKVKFAAKHGT